MQMSKGAFGSGIKGMIEGAMAMADIYFKNILLKDSRKTELSGRIRPHRILFSGLRKRRRRMIITLRCLV